MTEPLSPSALSEELAKIALAMQSERTGHTPKAVTVVASVDELGHWPARDWRRYPMSAHRDRWEASIPVEVTIRPSPSDAPIVPLQVLRPRQAVIAVADQGEGQILGLERLSEILTAKAAPTEDE